MTKPREGFHTASIQYPIDVWERLRAEAARQGKSVNRMLAEEAAERFGLTVPAPKQPGPKPRKTPPADAAKTRRKS